MNADDALDDALDQVHARASFLAFVQALVADARANPDEWQNATAEDFLEAALASVRDNEPTNDFLREPKWKDFAEFPHGGNIYE